ncbi:hypothetical protein BDY24DRAFT_334499, partial [Mrakia frigida]|uniref:DUF427 domain-containing protein n=1 Tax=Mrakia frigida TaxID=29902 RepID=UPI003FCC1952
DWYFPEECVETDLFTKSDTTTDCPWKGTAHYYNFKDVKDIAWYYPDPKEKAAEIKGFVAFYVSKV